MSREMARNFCTAHKLGEECVNELSDIMNKVLGNIGRHHLAVAPPAAGRQKCIGKNKKGEPCRFYSIDGTISVAKPRGATHRTEYCKNHCPKSPKETSLPTKCNGMTADGRICDKKGEKVDGAKYNYCSRHKESWKLYEGTEASQVCAQVDDAPEQDSDYELFNGTDSDEELTFDQKVEMIANDMDILEYKTSTKVYDEIKAKTAKELNNDEMEKWVTNNNLPVEAVEKAVEKVETLRRAKAKKSTSRVKKMQDKIKKNSDIIDMKNKKYAEEYNDDA